jgi:hypothetical protein
MDEQFMIGQLEKLAESLGLQIRHEPMHQDEESIKLVGGLCWLKGENVLIINSRATVRDKIEAFVQALRHFDLEGIYIKPAIRELLDTTVISVTVPVIVKEES